MNKTALPPWVYGVLSLAGVVLVASMVVNWIDVGGETVTGLGLAWKEAHWLFLVPVAGALLAVSASMRSEHTRLVAIAAGVVVSGNVLFQFAKSLVDSGLDTWLVFGGAGVILGGASKQRRGWRVVGGLAVIVGFFAPWDSSSLWKVLTSSWLVSDGFGVTVRLLWLVPLAGLAAIGSGLSSRMNDGRLALVAGLTVFGSFAWVIGSAANLVLGWGAWAAVGASATALGIGLFASANGKAVPASV